MERLDTTITLGLPAQAREIRQLVFVEEQGFTEEFDAIDDRAYHIVATADCVSVGTARMYRSAEEEYTIGRVAVLSAWRGFGIGKRMIERLTQSARDSGAARIVLYAQLHAEGFYRKAGFQSLGIRVYEDGVEHVAMEKRLR